MAHVSDLDALAIRRRLRKHDPGWNVPEPWWGGAGWSFTHTSGEQSCIVSCADYDGTDWVHASITGPGAVPDYYTLKVLHRAVWGDNGWSYQVFTPTEEHINIHEHALHLWGRLDGKPVLPDFTRGTNSI
jgi:hypothetical protein